MVTNRTSVKRVFLEVLQVLQLNGNGIGEMVTEFDQIKLLTARLLHETWSIFNDLMVWKWYRHHNWFSWAFLFHKVSSDNKQVNDK